MAVYTEAELGRLRSAIAGLYRQDSATLQEVEKAVADGRCPIHLAPFWRLVSGESEAAAGRDLFDKLSGDPLLSVYSFYGFFPGIYRRVYQERERPEITLDGRTRGPVALLRFSNGEGVAVKPLQNSREEAIARLAGDAGVGPRQLPSLDGFIVEELVPGTFLHPVASRTSLIDEFLYLAGRRLGEMLAALHSAQIYYNDATISDPEGRSHLIVELEGNGNQRALAGARLIDFGVSVLLDNHPALELEEVFSIARTTPEFRILSRMGIQGPDLRQFLIQYRRRLAAQSREEIMARDIRFTEEGLRAGGATHGAEHYRSFPRRIWGWLWLAPLVIPTRRWYDEANLKVRKEPGP